MSDPFEHTQKSMISPVTKFKAYTPSNDVDLKTSDSEFYPKGIMVTSGVVVLEDEDGNITTFTDGQLATGIWLPMRPVKIRASDNESPANSTTATVFIGI